MKMMMMMIIMKFQHKEIQFNELNASNKPGTLPRGSGAGAHRISSRDDDDDVDDDDADDSCKDHQVQNETKKKLSKILQHDAHGVANLCRRVARQFFSLRW